MAEEPTAPETPAMPVEPEQPSNTEAPNRGGFWSKFGGLFGGRGEESGTNDELQRGDVVNMFDALVEDLDMEAESSNPDVSVQDNNSLAQRMLDHPGFASLFQGVDSIILAEGREIKSAIYKQNQEHKSINIGEMNEIIDAERDRLGDKAKALL